jgi:hypothetical protein
MKLWFRQLRDFLTLSGKKNYDKVGQVFGTNYDDSYRNSICHIVFAETLGLWFVNYKLNHLNRINAANWVYQLSIMGYINKCYQSSYNAAIIAYERILCLFKYSRVLLKINFSFTTYNWERFDETDSYMLY